MRQPPSGWRSQIADVVAGLGERAGGVAARRRRRRRRSRRSAPCAGRRSARRTSRSSRGPRARSAPSRRRRRGTRSTGAGGCPAARRGRRRVPGRGARGGGEPAVGDEQRRAAASPLRGRRADDRRRSAGAGPTSPGMLCGAGTVSWSSAFHGAVAAARDETVTYCPVVDESGAAERNAMGPVVTPRVPSAETAAQPGAQGYCPLGKVVAAAHARPPTGRGWKRILVVGEGGEQRLHHAAARLLGERDVGVGERARGGDGGGWGRSGARLPGGRWRGRPRRRGRRRRAAWRRSRGVLGDARWLGGGGGRGRGEGGESQRVAHQDHRSGETVAGTEPGGAAGVKPARRARRERPHSTWPAMARPRKMR